MLADTVPETLNFVRQVELKRKIEGVYPVARLQRLSQVLESDEGEIEVKLEFGETVGYASLKGKVAAELTTQCQRCLQPMLTPVTGSFKFALVHNEDEFELLPDELEPYLLEGEEQSIIELIEDELLLSLPMVTSHESDCSDYMKKQNVKVRAVMEAEKEKEREETHPFAALKALKEGKKN